MPLNPREIQTVIQSTDIVRPPKQFLATFGTTVLEYYIVTEPSYAGLPGAGDEPEAVVRTGKVTAAQPQIVTPFYLMNLFDGFEHGQEFARYVRAAYGEQAPGLMYSYRQEPGEMNVVSDPAAVVADRIAGRLERDGVRLAVVIRGVDQYWDVSLAYFIYTFTAGSALGNAVDLGRQGLLETDRGGLPRAVHSRIESMFRAVQAGEMEGSELKEELDRWGLFREYEDRFLGLYRGR